MREQQSPNAVYTSGQKPALSSRSQKFPGPRRVTLSRAPPLLMFGEAEGHRARHPVGAQARLLRSPCHACALCSARPPLPFPGISVEYAYFEAGLFSNAVHGASFLFSASSGFAQEPETCCG